MHEFQPDSRETQDLLRQVRAGKRCTRGDRPRIAHRLRQWRCDHDLAGQRDPAAVARLPADEQEACRQFWADGEALLSRGASVR